MIIPKIIMNSLASYGTMTYKTGDKFFVSTQRLVPVISGYTSVRSDKFDTLEEAIADLNTKFEALKQRQEFLANNHLELLAELCQKHDWNYVYSDDSSKYDAGKRNHDMMRQIIEEHGDPAKEIWNAHVPSQKFQI